MCENGLGNGAGIRMPRKSTCRWNNDDGKRNERKRAKRGGGGDVERGLTVDDTHRRMPIATKLRKLHGEREIFRLPCKARRTHGNYRETRMKEMNDD